MATISTHVLDTAVGKPAEGVTIELSVQDDDGWKTIGGGTTNSDGRVTDLLREEFKPLEIGLYKIRFDVAAYMAARGVENFFYPYVEFPFRIEASDEHYHVPLLVSPYGFSTYRGS